MKTAAPDACEMEHAVSAKTYQALKSLVFVYGRRNIRMGILQSAVVVGAIVLLVLAF